MEVEGPVEQDPVALVEPHVYMEEELHAADPKLQELIVADWQLIDVFGHTIYQNDGSNLLGKALVAMDTSW